MKQKNKLVKLADTSDGGWETVKQYQANPLASDSEDEKKYRRQSIELRRKTRKNYTFKNAGKKHFKLSQSGPFNSLSSCLFPA